MVPPQAGASKKLSERVNDTVASIFVHSFAAFIILLVIGLVMIGLKFDDAAYAFAFAMTVFMNISAVTLWFGPIFVDFLRRKEKADRRAPHD